MKNIAKKLILFTLKLMAKLRLRGYKGKVIAITGSVGKTSTKDAIFTVLNTQFKVKKTDKSMNSEFGLLLTILEIDSGFSSATKWIWFLIVAFFHAIIKEHSEVMVLEFGVDKPGDMDFLLSVLKPNIVVFTGAAPVHLADGQFKTVQEVFEEKKKLVEALKQGGKAILNQDNSFSASLAKKLQRDSVITYGKDPDSEYLAHEISTNLEGLRFIMTHKDQHAEVVVPVLGEYQASVLLPAIICGKLFGVDYEQSIFTLQKYTLPPGRMSVIPGKDGITILDSSYNSSPEAAKEALKVLRDVAKDNRKIAVLGNMNELGDQSQSLHEAVGRIVPSCADVLVTVGADAKFLMKAAVEEGLAQENAHNFRSVSEAMEFCENLLQEGDIVLVKGSQNNVRLEKFVKHFMQNPEDAKKLLVRQERVWESKI